MSVLNWLSQPRRRECNEENLCHLGKFRVSLIGSFVKTVFVALSEQFAQLFLSLLWDCVDLKDCLKLLGVRHGLVWVAACIIACFSGGRKAGNRPARRIGFRPRY